MNMTTEEIDIALNSKDYRVRIAAISNPNANKENIDKALNDPHPFVVSVAISNIKVTPEQIAIALTSSFLLNVFIHLHNLVAIMSSAFSLICLLDFGFGIL